MPSSNKHTCTGKRDAPATTGTSNTTSNACQEEDNNLGFQRRIAGNLLGMTLFLVVALITWFSETPRRHSQAGWPLQLQAQDPALFQLIKGAFMDQLGDHDNAHVHDHLEALLMDPESPQARAFAFVSQETHNPHQYAYSSIQRYAMASFFYATNAVRNSYVKQPVPWTSAEHWLTEQHACDWEGVICEQKVAHAQQPPNNETAVHVIDDGVAFYERVITGINLGSHGITGTLPLDLALLGPHLTFLNLSSNLLFMMDSTATPQVLPYLTNLETLVLNDNYIVEQNHGLPSSLRSLTNLQRLELSDNLLQKQIDPTYFDAWTRLTHLNIERNYFTGPLPTSLLQLESLQIPTSWKQRL